MQQFLRKFTVAGGRLVVTNPAVTVDAVEITMTEDNTVGNTVAYTTNAATLLVRTYSQGFGTSDNAGTITVREILNFTGGTFRGAGTIVMEIGGLFSGGGNKSIIGQRVINHGAVGSIGTAVSFSGGAHWENRAGR